MYVTDLDYSHYEPSNYNNGFDYYVEQVIQEKYIDAKIKIEEFFGIENTMNHIIHKISKALREEDTWASELCYEEIGLDEMHLAALKDDQKEMAYLINYDNNERYASSHVDD
jgi:hypothetical protein